MIPITEIVLKFATELESPEELFTMVMDYAKRTGKNKWLEFGMAFAANKGTVIVTHNGKAIGYCNAELCGSDLFLNHGYLNKRVAHVDVLMEMIFVKFTEKMDVPPSRMVLHADDTRANERLWTRWGFNKSNTIIWEKEMGGMTNR